jgi:hypothetical protein
LLRKTSSGDPLSSSSEAAAVGTGGDAGVGASGSGKYTISLFKSSIDNFGDVMLLLL